MSLPDDNIGNLCKCEIFKGVSPDEITDILSKNFFRKGLYEKDQYVLHSNTTCSELPVLITGKLRAEMTNHAGRTVKIEDIKAPAVLASAFLFGAENLYPVDAIAQDFSMLIYIPRSSLQNIFKTHPKVLTNFLNDVSNRAQFLSKKIKFLAFNTIRVKLAHYLLDLAKQQHSLTIILPVTHLQLAEFFGVTRPSLSREIIELEKISVLSARRNKIHILDEKQLIVISGN